MHVRRRRTVIGGLSGCLAGAALTLAVAGPATAKGPQQVTITAPGGDPIEIPATPPPKESDGEPRPLFEPEAVAPEARFVRLSEDLGIWETAGDGAALVPEAPTGYLGPALTVEWAMYNPTPANPDAAPSVVQTVYPLAEGGALVHTEGGQRYFGTGETVAGWFRAPDDLLATLEASGVEVELRTPDVTPARGGGTAAADLSQTGGQRTWLLPTAVGTVVVAAAGLAARVAWRPRPSDATTAAG